ncbi:hypothetical protein SBA3_2430013 [Candidatus Sulfopaludibacter sp. SbA3]|nr:hypothetical protein SBA3_2430013 [Candidatus Sulfopaludibacter sp. SbA3]
MAALCCGAAEQLAFEVASVKQAPPHNGGFITKCSGGPGTADPIRFTCTETQLAAFLARAYDVQFYQIGGPDRITTERFQLSVHRATKDLPTYSVSVEKGGPELQPSAAAVSPEDHPQRPCRW